MTAPIAEQPEDVRARPAAVTLVVVIATIAACVGIISLLLGPAHHTPVSQPAVPTSQPFTPTTPLEQHRAAEARAIDTWLPAEIDRYLEAHR